MTDIEETAGGKAPPPPAARRQDLNGLNGLMIRTLAVGRCHFQKPEYVQAAEKAAEFILKNAR